MINLLIINQMIFKSRGLIQSIRRKIKSCGKCCLQYIIVINEVDIKEW